MRERTARPYRRRAARERTVIATAALALLASLPFGASAQTRIPTSERRPSAPVITTVAGNGEAGYSGDGGPATWAHLREPAGLAVDGSGNLFIADSGNHRVRRVDPSGIITSVAGNGEQGYSGDGGPAMAARLSAPRGVAVDRAGNVFVSDDGNRRVRRIDPSGAISTVAGNGERGVGGDGGPATAASLSMPKGVAVDASGILLILDSGRVRKVDASGVITTVAGGGTDHPDEAGTATSLLVKPLALAAGRGGELFVTAYIMSVARVDPAGAVSTVVGGERARDPDGEGRPATSAELDVSSLALSPSGTLLVSHVHARPDLVDPWGRPTRLGRIREVDRSGRLRTVAGGGSWPGDGVAPTSAQLLRPGAMAVDDAGNLFVVEVGASRVRKLPAP